MAIRCSKCQREYDTKLFESGRGLVCECGARLGFEHQEILRQLESICREYDLELEEEKISEIKAAQDRIVFLIMDANSDPVDIEIAKREFKELIQNLFPDKVHLYDLIYAPRFERLWEQFRES